MQPKHAKGLIRSHLGVQGMIKLVVDDGGESGGYRRKHEIVPDISVAYRAIFRNPE